MELSERAAKKCELKRNLKKLEKKFLTNGNEYANIAKLTATAESSLYLVN